DMCHAVVVRSSVAHGEIRSIDASSALEVDGVIAVFTANDIDESVPPIPVRVGGLKGLERCVQYPLARERVRYVGEPLAIVIAISRHIAEDAADMVFADIEPLEVVVDARNAGRSIALHSDVPDNRPVHYQVQRGSIDEA